MYMEARDRVHLDLKRPLEPWQFHLILFFFLILFLWKSRNQPKVLVEPESEALVNTEREGCVCLSGHTV